MKQSWPLDRNEDCGLCRNVTLTPGAWWLRAGRKVTNEVSVKPLIFYSCFVWRDVMSHQQTTTTKSLLPRLKLFPRYRLRRMIGDCWTSFLCWSKASGWWCRWRRTGSSAEGKYDKSSVASEWLFLVCYISNIRFLAPLLLKESWFVLMVGDKVGWRPSLTFVNTRRVWELFVTMMP